MGVEGLGGKVIAMRPAARPTIRALLLGTLAVLLLPLLTASPASAVEPQASIDNIDAYPRYVTSSTMEIEVTYTCTNTPAPNGVVHYISASLTQGDAARYSMGFRQDSVINLTQATCTGKAVTQTLTLARSGQIAESVPDPVTGPAEITVQLERYGTADVGGTNTIKGLGATKTQTVSLACNGPYTAGRCHPPKMVATKVNWVSSVIAYTSRTTMRTRLKYTCQNLPGPLGRVHYLLVDFTKGPADGSRRVHYSVGSRSEKPTLRARCTGKPVTQYVKLTGYFFPRGKKNPTPGHGKIGATLTPRGTSDMGGWHVSTGADVTAVRRATLVCARHLAPGKRLPAVCKHSRHHR